MPDKTERAQRREGAAETALSKRLTDFADESLEVYDRNRRYKPNRETDKYILDRLLENIPGMRPSAIEDEHYPYGHRLLPTPKGRTMSQLETAVFKEPAYTDKPATPSAWGGYDTTKLDRLKGLESMEKDLEVFRTGYGTDRKAWDEAVERLRSAGRRVSYRIPEYISAADKKTIDELRGEVAEDMTSPGAQEDRPGRIQEIVEALDLTNPDSGGRAFLRELKRRAIDDRLPRIQAGWKTQTGEEVLKDKLIEMELADIPRNRAAAMQALGWSGIPKAVQIKDDSGNPVPLYADDRKAAREAAAEKAYMQHRRDPMKDTPERD